MFQNLFNRLYAIKNNEVALNTALQFFERLVGLGCSFISSICIIRYFEPAEYGIFAYASSYVTLFSALTTMGIQPIAVREMVKKNASIEDIMGSSFAIMIIGATFAAILAIGGAIYSHEQSVAKWVILILCLINIINSFAVINYYFQSEIKSRYYAYIMLAQDIIDISMKISLVYLKANLISFALIGLIEAVFANCGLYLIFRNYTRMKKWSVNFKVVKILFHQSLPLAISGVVINLYMRLDQVLIEYYCGMQAVAEYSVGIKLVEVFYMIPMIITPNVLPIAVKYYEKSEEALDKFLIKLIRIYSLTSFVIIILIWILSPFLIVRIYGQGYASSVDVFKYSSLLIFLSCIGASGSLWLNIKGLQKYSLLRAVSGLIVCLGANLAFIPRFGIVGAAYATLIAQFTAIYLSSFLFPQIRKYNNLVNCSIFGLKLSKI